MVKSQIYFLKNFDTNILMLGRSEDAKFLYQQLQDYAFRIP